MDMENLPNFAPNDEVESADPLSPRFLREWSQSTANSSPRAGNSFESNFDDEADLDDLLDFCRSTNAELKYLSSEYLIGPEDFEVDNTDSAKCILGEGGQAKIFSAFVRGMRLIRLYSSTIRDMCSCLVCRPPGCCESLFASRHSARVCHCVCFGISPKYRQSCWFHSR